MARRDRFLDEKYHRIRSHYGGTCLDVGSGFGDFAAFLRSTGVLVTAIDVVNKGHHPDIETRIFDGLTIPFPDLSFDTAIAMFVLHHAQDQLRLLRELGRVTRRRIIIAEDLVETAADRLMGSIHLWLSAWGAPKDSFHSDIGWRDIFDSLGWRVLEAVAIPRRKEPLYPIHRQIYVIEAPPEHRPERGNACCKTRHESER